MGMRYYKADWGGFIDRDPSGESGGANLFAYCVNDPVNKTDALGLDWTTDRLQMINTLIAGEQHQLKTAIGSGRLALSQSIARVSRS
jgi:hypothetical protein